MTGGGREPAGVLVSGVAGADTGTIGSALAALGLMSLTANQAMVDLAQRVLSAAGGSWAGLPQISPSEFSRLGDRFAREAQGCLREVLASNGSSEDETWVWADPSHSLLVPFWRHALELDLSIVHVHRDPLTAMAALSTERDITAESALEVWERYSRAALVSCGSWSSVVIGAQAVSIDPGGSVRLLSDFLDRVFGARDRALEDASRAFDVHRGDFPVPAGALPSVLTSHRVLDQILRELEGVINDGAANEVGKSRAFAHLSELYDAEYYAEYDGGVPYTRSEPHWISFFAEVADNIVKKIAPKTSFDAGCAIGMLVEALRERDVDARGIDISSWAIDQIPEGLRPYCQVGSITEPIEGHYDLITCIEVLEHLPAAEADAVIDNFCAHADAVLFSSTPDDFEDPTHLNVETTSYWAELFARRGFFRDPDHDAAYLAPQAILFRKTHGSPHLVGDYERVIWQLNEAHATYSRTLEEGWKAAAARVDDLEQLLIEGPGVSDERTVDALERLVGVDSLRSLVAGPPVTGDPDASRFTADDYARWRATRGTPSPPLKGPSFSIIVPVFDPVAEHLVACLHSVRAQTYDNWELVLVNVSHAPHVQPICERFEQLDPRVHVVPFENAGIAANTHVGVQASHGEWVTFLDHDDTLEPHALAAVARHIDDHPDVGFVYSDEDKLSPTGSYVDPFFKPDWSPDLLRNVNYICHLVSVRRNVYDEVGGLRSGFEGAQDYDFVLRATAATRQVGHVADVLYHWRQHEGSTASDVTFKPEAHSAGRRALEQFTRKHLPGAWVEPAANRTSHRVRYPLGPEKVSIVIPFRDRPELTDSCIRSIARSRIALPLEVLLVSNQSSEEATFRYMQEWEEQFNWTKVVAYDEPFNFQSLNNWAARRAEGSLLLFMNNDVEVLHPDWLDALAENAQRPEIGAVGPRLFYPDGLVQHAGVALGIGGLADHPWAGQHPDTWTPAGPSYWTRNLLAVTAACLMVEHAKFDEINGFDERFEVCGGDVDLCLRLFQNGYWNLMTPFARLIHHESVTRPKHPPEADVRESLRSYARYLKDGDPFFNRNLSRSDRSCRIAAPSIVDPREARR